MKTKSFVMVAFLALSLASALGVQVTPIMKAEYPHLNLVYRAAKSVESATSVGVDYSKLEELIQNLATEIAIAEDKVTAAREKSVLERYKIAFIAYRVSLDAWTSDIKDGRKAGHHLVTLAAWSQASEELRVANAYYLNNTKEIAAIEAKEKAKATTAKARETASSANWPVEVDKYIQGFAIELRESVKRECLRLGPSAEVWYRQGDSYYHYSVRYCPGIPEDEKAVYIRDAHQITLREAIKVARRCPLCEPPINTVKK